MFHRFMKPPPSKPPSSQPGLSNAGTLLKRFGAGAAVGLGVAAIYLGYAQAWHPQSWTTGAIVSLILAIVFGGLTMKWGYNILQLLWESMNLP